MCKSRFSFIERSVCNVKSIKCIFCHSCYSFYVLQLHGPLPDRDSLASAASGLGFLVGMLAKSSLQPSSIPTYMRAWKLFYQFLNAIFHSVVTELPISPHTLALFLAYMYDKNYAPSTVSSYVSAQGYSHRLLSFPDPRKAFFIIQMLKGYTKLGSRLDSRLPITLPILHRIIEGASQLAISQLHCCQFQAMCAIAFYGFLRISEITSNSLKNADVPLQVHQLVKLIDTSQQIVFGNFKHNYNQRPFSIVISRQASVCPVLLLLEYARNSG